MVTKARTRLPAKGGPNTSNSPACVFNLSIASLYTVSGSSIRRLCIQKPVNATVANDATIVLNMFDLLETSINTAAIPLYIFHVM